MQSVAILNGNPLYSFIVSIQHSFSDLQICQCYMKRDFSYCQPPLYTLVQKMVLLNTEVFSVQYWSDMELQMRMLLKSILYNGSRKCET